MMMFYRFFLLVSLLVYSQLAQGQHQTLNDYIGAWETGASWLNGSQPDPLANGINVNISVYGYITANSSLSFAANNESKSIIIYDTLVVKGDMHFNNKAMDLVVEDGGLLVVFGDFSATNKISIANGGTMAVTGNMTFSDSGQDTFENIGDGKLYVDGTISGNTDADGIDEPTTSLDGSAEPGEQQLFNFINNEGETLLPITLSYFTGALQHKSVALAWETLTEENFDYFEVQRSVNGAAFETIGAVKGNGFTSEPQQYAFTDPSPRIGFNYYRLNAVDYDGTSELFQVISVEVKPDFSSVRIYPNPNNGDSFTLAIPENLQGGIFNLAVTDVNGNVLLEQQVAESTVQASFQSKLAPGIYFVSLETLNYTSTLRLLVN